MKKNVIKILIACAALVVVYTIIWTVYVDIVYLPYIKALDGEKSAVIDGYEYTVCTPIYPSFSGNLSVKESKRNRDVYSETTAGLLIWPSINGECRFHVMLETPTEIYDEYSSGSYIYGYELNSELKPDLSTQEFEDNYNEHKDFFEDNWDKVETMLKKTQSVFNISL